MSDMTNCTYVICGLSADNFVWEWSQPGNVQDGEILVREMQGLTVTLALLPALVFRGKDGQGEIYYVHLLLPGLRAQCPRKFSCSSSTPKSAIFILSQNQIIIITTLVLRIKKDEIIEFYCSENVPCFLSPGFTSVCFVCVFFSVIFLFVSTILPLPHILSSAFYSLVWLVV